MHKKFIILFFTCLLFILLPCIYLDAEEVNGITISPQIIDEKVEARDSLAYDVTITNNTDKKIKLYAQVYDITENEGRQEFVEPAKLDKSTSLARWISIKRAAIELMPGETVSEELDVKVNLSAAPGIRHAVIAFSEGSNMYEARGSLDSKKHPQVLLNFEVIDNIIEKAQIKKFKTTRNIYTEVPVEFELEIENFGNREIVPGGKLLIYNRQGVELSAINIKEEMQAISAGEIGSTKLKWQPTKVMGKFKAKLEVEYGSIGSRDLQDTVYFWVLPLPYLLGFFGGILFIITLLVFMIFRKTYVREHVHDMQSVNKSNGVINLKDDN